ncbi:MAG: tetratricopeptide repeat protein [Candidatus Gygaella obscura]|nr:tetratricopeptide repeat protein [Candidatus Gygaella obscura]
MALNKNIIIAFLAIFILGWFVYINNLDNSFVYDDYLLVVDNPAVKSFKYLPDIFKHDLYYYVSASNFYRPIVSLSLMFDFAFWKYNFRGYHLTNNLLHILNVLLLFFLIRKISGNEALSLITAVLFMVHPLHTQAVTYISGRADLLYVFFGLLSLGIFIHASQSKSILLTCLSCFCYILSLLSKEVALVFPFLILMIMFLFYKEYLSFRKYGIFLLIAAFYLLMRMTLLKEILNNPQPVSLGLGVRLLNMPKVLFAYILLLIFPVGLHIDRTFDVSFSFFKKINFNLWPFSFQIERVDYQLLFSWLILILFIVLLIRIGKKEKLMLFSSLWFFIAFLPLSGILALNALIAEHWIYLPSVGFFLIIAALVYRLNSTYFLRYFSLVVFCTIVLSYSLLTIKRNRDWKDEIALYTSTLFSLNGKGSPRLYYNLGCAYLDRGMVNKAITQYKKAISLRPKRKLLYYYSLSLAYLVKKDYNNVREAIKNMLNIPAANINEERLLNKAKDILEKIKEK